jgi:hypothetical protein
MLQERPEISNPFRDEEFRRNNGKQLTCSVTYVELRNYNGNRFGGLLAPAQVAFDRIGRVAVETESQN